ncbi:hypothetical protein [Psychromonas ossibalaenae]|uniref:hypothetical protein n=1 Tax=Psychromonas ossibalaenae TaxID=444922 RepID=UPI00035E2701|nr:hypothetical protein [Psychromonas ossibalaenae]
MKTANCNIMFLALSVAGLLFGGYFASMEWFVGPSYVANDGLFWTLPLVAYIFLALTSTGISILMTAGELLDNKAVKAHKLSLLTAALSLLIGAFAALATEMGSPFHVIWLLFSPNLSSPIWWMGTLYAVELLLLGFKYYLLLRGRPSNSEQWLTSAALCVAVAAALVLGSVFGTAVGRTGYQGADASVLTLLCALASGLSLAPLLFKEQAREVLLLPGRRLLAGLAVFLLTLYLYSARSTVLADIAWVQLWMPLLLLASMLVYKAKPAVSALIALPTLLLVELFFVIQGQLQVLGPKQTWLGAVQSYLPNTAEIAILIFGCSVAYLCFFLFNQLQVRLGGSSD